MTEKDHMATTKTWHDGQHCSAASVHHTISDNGCILAASDQRCGQQVHFHTFLAYTPYSLLRPCLPPSSLAGCPAGTSLTCMSMSCVSQILGALSKGSHWMSYVWPLPLHLHEPQCAEQSMCPRDLTAWVTPDKGSAPHSKHIN